MALTLAPRGVAACSPWCKPWELEPNKTQAPDGNAVTDFAGEMSRFGASHGCDWEPWLAPKRLSIRFYLIKNPSRRCHSGLTVLLSRQPTASTVGYMLSPLSWLKSSKVSAIRLAPRLLGKYRGYRQNGSELQPDFEL